MTTLSKQIVGKTDASNTTDAEVVYIGDAEGDPIFPRTAQNNAAAIASALGIESFKVAGFVGVSWGKDTRQTLAEMASDIGRILPVRIIDEPSELPKAVSELFATLSNKPGPKPTGSTSNTPLKPPVKAL